MSDTATEAPASNVPPETLLYYTHELTRTKRRIDEANSAHRLLIKRAKQDGVPTVAILESIADARLEPEVRRQKIIDRIRVEATRYPQNGQEIVSLLGGLDIRVSDRMRYTDTLFDAEQKGYHAGKSGVPVEENPYPAGSEQAQTWRQFWGNGQAASAIQHGEHARAASTRRERTPRTRTPALPLETPRKRGRRAGNGGDAAAP